MQPARALRVFATAAVTGVAVVLLAGVLGRVEPGALARARAELAWGWVVALIGAFAVNHALRIVRWGVILAADTPWRRVVVVCLVSFLGIVTLPLRLGELLRPALHAADGVPVGRTVAALLVERILDLAMLLALLAWAATVPPVPPLVVDGVDVGALGRRAAAVGIGVLGAGLVVAAILGGRIAGWRWVGPPAANLAAAARELAGSGRRALAAVGLTAAIWASTIVYTSAALRTLPSLPRSVEAAAFTWAGVMAAITALPTPGFFGSYEAGGAGALTLYGADRDLAVVMALGMHVLYTAFVAVLGIPYAVAELGVVADAIRGSRGSSGR
jgi:hypothetical protein